MFLALLFRLFHIAIHTLAQARGSGISLGPHEIHTSSTNISLIHNLLSDKLMVSELVQIYKPYHNGVLNASKHVTNDVRDSGVPLLRAFQSTTETVHGRKSWSQKSSSTFYWTVTVLCCFGKNKLL